MDESEKLTALKKAYADIILNTAKEAAARVVVSERKALRFQRELFSTKDEAFRMLLRLKQMLDSKAGEAKMMSLSQQIKIDELEAQLQEAEDIVKDLREELSEVQAQLEKATNNQAQPLDGQNLEADTAAPGSIVPQRKQLGVVTTYEKNSVSNGTYEASRCYSANDSLKDYVDNPDFGSLVMRSKEPELYRNGCTQRIRAFERNLLDEKLSLSVLVDDGKNATFIRGDEEGKVMFKMPKPMVDNTNRVEKNPEEVKVMKADGRQHQAPAFKSFQRKRKRAARYRRNNAPSCRYLPHQFMEVHQVSDFSCSRTSASSVNNSVLTDNALKKSEDEIRKGTVSISTPKLLSETTEISMQSGCANVTDNNAEFVRACKVQRATNNYKAFIEESELTRQEYLSAESLEVLACKTDIEKDSRPLDNSDKKASDLANGTASQPVNNKFLKYTFRRKRKKETLTSPEMKSHLHNDDLERKTGEEQNGFLEPQKSSLLIESSRDSRRLAQVAHQLISLSENKWWK